VNKLIQMARCLVLMATVSMVTASANAQVLYVIGGPAALEAESLPGFTRSVIRVVLNGEPGDRVRVFDAFNQTSIADIAVPRSRTPQARLRMVAPKIASIQTHYSKAQPADEPPGHLLHLPNFLDTVASITGPGFDETRILLIGSMGFGNGTDTRYDFGPASFSYPSDGHILASSSVSVYGTVNKPKLSNTRIDILNTDPFEDDVHRYHVQRFWSLYTKERGAVLSSWSTDASLAVERVSGERGGPLLNMSIDRRDLRREILRVDGVLMAPNVWTLVICIDASASMQAAFDELRREIPDLAARLYDAGAQIRIAIIPFREDVLPAMPLTTVRSAGSDGGRSLSRVNAYLDGVSVESAQVDPGNALRAGMAMIERDADPETFTYLLIIGDTGPEIRITGEDYQGLLEDLRSWHEGGQGRFAEGVLFGSGDDGDVRYFRETAQAGGGGVTTSFALVADQVVKQAADVTRGTRPE